MAIINGICYDPAVAVTKSTAAAAAMTAFDTTNLRLTFMAPARGIVQVRICCTVHGATTMPSILLGVMSGANVVGRVSPIGGLKNTAVATAMVTQEAVFLVNGLTPGQEYVADAAYGVETGVAATGIKYGGPNDTTANNAFGGVIFEIWNPA
jgi:hypothetical protein